MRRLLATAMVASLAFAVVGVPGPAAAADLPVIVSPARGGALPAGSRGPLVIDFPTPGAYDVTVECGDLYSWTNDYGETYSGRETIPIDPLVAYEPEEMYGASCTVSTFSWDDVSSATATSTFRVRGPALTLGALRTSRDVFYPIVRDRYRDDTEFRFVLNRSAAASLAVTNSAGRTVYRASRSLSEGAGTYRWTWKGRTNAGAPVKRGRYVATITATVDGVTRTSRVAVRVASKKVIRRQTLRKDWLSSRDSTRGSCYTSLDDYDESTLLDCWGGDFAATTFTFKVPANAKSLAWKVAVSRNSLDKCCHGSITKSGRRVGRTRFQIRVQVTGWRSANVYGARISYKARVRI